MKYEFSSFNQSDSLVKLRRQYLLNKSTAIFQNEMQMKNGYKQINPTMLDFLDEYVKDTSTLKIK